MSKPDECVFVLWGKGFHEATATIFVTELRRTGLRVKVVGLTQRRSSGAFGLALLPDVTLEQILPLAGRAICKVVPYTPSGNNRLRNDPRLSKLFEKVHANNGKFIVGQLDKVDLDLFHVRIGRRPAERGHKHLFNSLRIVDSTGITKHAVRPCRCVADYSRVVHHGERLGRHVRDIASSCRTKRFRKIEDAQEWI